MGVARHLPGVLRGSQLSSPKIHQHQVSRVRIESANGHSVPFELDGELMSQSSPWFEIEVVEDALRILEEDPEDVGDAKR